MCETHANNVEIGEDRRGPTTLSGSTYMFACLPITFLFKLRFTGRKVDESAYSYHPRPRHI